MNDSQSDPATQRQKDFATALGINYPDDISKRAISELIDAAVTKKDWDRNQDILADFAEMEKNDPRLSYATSEQIVAEFEQRNLGAILITFEVEGVDFCDPSSTVGLRFDISHSLNLSKAEVSALLFTLGQMHIKQLEEFQEAVI